MAPDPELINAFINPLGFPQVDLPSGTTSPTETDFLRFACALDVEADLASIVTRYKELGAADEPFITPTDAQFLGKVIWPLRHAKAAYCLGSYVASIALCGAVGEMTAELLFEMHRPKANVNGRDLDESMQREVLGCKFERLTQDRKIRFLRALEIIGDEQRDRLNDLRTKRNGYMHRYSDTLENAKQDAILCYKLATKAVVDAIGLKFARHGGYNFDPSFLEYLSKNGVLGWALRPEPPLEEEEDPEAVERS